MEQIEFDIWWKEYFDQFHARTEGYEIVESLIQYIDELNDLKRQAFIDELVAVVLHKGSRWEFAAEILEKYASIDQRNKVCYKLIDLKILDSIQPISTEDGFYLSCLIRILSCEKTNEFIPIIQTYIEYHINDPWFTSICWRLWRTHKDYAVQGWVKFFISNESNAKSHSVIIQAFQNNPDALRSLKSELIKQSPSIWKVFSDTILDDDMTDYLSQQEKKTLYSIIKSS